MTTDTIRPPRTWELALRWAGWVFIVAGAVVALFIVYLLWWTGRETAAVQDESLEEWTVALGEAEGLEGVEEFDLDASGEGLDDLPVVTDPADGDDVAVPADAGSAVALLWFERGGERILIDRILSVFEGVDLPNLMNGPGHYPDTAGPGEAGNFAVAGHRTTSLAPFYNLDQLQDGDEIHVVDRAGNHWVYDFRDLEVVAPSDVWVLDDDPTGAGGDGWLTLTTCHPRFSARQRLVAFASLRTAA